MPVYENIVYFNWTLLFNICNTLILFFVLKHFLYDKVKKMLDSRKDEVEKEYAEADEARAKAVAMKAEYENQLNTAKEQANDILKSAKEKAQSKTDELLADAQQKAAAALSRAEAQIELDRKKVAKEVKDDIAGLAIDAAEKVLKKELDQSAHEKLINDFIENSGGITWQN